MAFGIKSNVKAAKARARRRVMKSWWEQQLPVLSYNSIEKFAVEMEETMKCEMYQMVEKAERSPLHNKKN